MDSTRSLYRHLSRIMEAKVGECLGEPEDGCRLTSITLAGGDTLCLELDETDPEDIRLSFQYLIVNLEESLEEDAGITSVDIMFSAKNSLWERGVSSDDGFIPDTIWEIAKTLEIELGGTFLTSQERAVMNVKQLISMYREKTGLR